MIVSFLGHRDYISNKEIESKLYDKLEHLVNIGADTFYCGGYGNFDKLCAKLIKELKVKYPHIKSYLITPYIDERTQNKLKKIREIRLYDDIIYPSLENVPPRFAISKRNEWVINNSDVVIAYVIRSWGGVSKTLRYAINKKKKIMDMVKLIP